MKTRLDTREAGQESVCNPRQNATLVPASQKNAEKGKTIACLQSRAFKKVLLQGLGRCIEICSVSLRLGDHSSARKEACRMTYGVFQMRA